MSGAINHQAIGVYSELAARREAVLAANRLDPYARARITGKPMRRALVVSPESSAPKPPKSKPIPRRLEEPRPFWNSEAGLAKLRSGELVAPPTKEPIPVGIILRAVCAAAGITFEQILNGGKARRLSHPRHVAMLLTHELRPELSLPQLGYLLCGMDHTSIIHGIREARWRIDLVGPSQVWYCTAKAALLAHEAAQ